MRIARQVDEYICHGVPCCIDFTCSVNHGGIDARAIADRRRGRNGREAQVCRRVHRLLLLIYLLHGHIHIVFFTRDLNGG